MSGRVLGGSSRLDPVVGNPYLETMNGHVRKDPYLEDRLPGLVSG